MPVHEDGADVGDLTLLERIDEDSIVDNLRRR